MKHHHEASVLPNENPDPAQAPCTNNLFSRLARSIYVFGGFCILFYSLVVLGIYVGSLVTGKTLEKWELVAMPLAGIVFLAAALYVFWGRHKWHAWFTGAVFALGFAACLGALFIKLSSPAPNGLPELVSGLAFCGFMFAGTIIKARGHWGARCWTRKPG